MKKLLTGACIAAVSLGAPAVAAAKPNTTDRQQAQRTCKQLRSESGKTNFASMYGEGKKGLGRCIQRESRENASERSQNAQNAQKNAAKECAAERDMSDADFAAAHPDDNPNNNTFETFYGTNGSDNGSSGQGKNAYGKCVSQHAKENRQEQAAEDRQEDKNQVNAARECRAEKNDPNFATTVSGGDNNTENDTFATYYGTNANHKNAFGKCVSKKAREKNDEQEQETTTTS